MFRSIIAGCESSVALTRVYLKNAMQSIYDKFPESNLVVFVEDTCMQATGDSFDATLDNVVPAVSGFGNDVRKLKFKLSEKATVTSSHPKLAFAFQNEMSTHYNMFFNVSGSSRDAGISHTAARSKPNTILTHRFVKRKNRVGRI